MPRSPVPARVSLLPYPGEPSGPVRGVSVAVERGARTLDLAYRLGVDPAAIRLPAAGPPRFASALWRRTCLEAFVAVEGAAGYHELHFSPSGEWAVLRFRGYRDGEELPDERLAPSTAWSRLADGIELRATVPLARLSAVHAAAPLRLSLCAVVETAGGEIRHWALRHAAGPPDFHAPEAFALRLEPPAGR